MIEGVVLDEKQRKIASNNTPVYLRVVYVKPIANHYEEKGEKRYIKYGCPVCEIIGHKHQVTEGSAKCSACSVNLIWEEPPEDEE